MRCSCRWRAWVVSGGAGACAAGWAEGGWSALRRHGRRRRSSASWGSRSLCRRRAAGGERVASSRVRGHGGVSAKRETLLRARGVIRARGGDCALCREVARGSRARIHAIHAPVKWRVTGGRDRGLPRRAAQMRCHRPRSWGVGGCRTCSRLLAGKGVVVCWVEGGEGLSPHGSGARVLTRRGPEVRAVPPYQNFEVNLFNLIFILAVPRAQGRKRSQGAN